MSLSVSDKVTQFFQAYPQRTYHKHEIILRPDEPLKSVLYITDGRVAQYDITPSGNEVVVNIFKPGAFLPMSTAINKTPNLYFFEASVKTSVYKAPVADVVVFVKDNPDVMFDLLSRVYRGIDGVLRRMAHLMGGDAKSRLIFELLNASARFGEAQPDGSIRLSLKEGEIGKHSGLARETVNRCLQELKANGLVTTANRTMTITDPTKLDELLGNKI